MKQVFAVIMLTISAFIPSEVKAQSDAPVVLELFTSQSCSSCPPADKVLSEWAEQPNVIALSCNVTYWNHLHWKDTLSREFCTQRQREYNAAFGRNGIYTPQLVINGTEQLVGSHGRKVEKEIRKASNAIKNIDLNIKGETLNIFLPELSEGKYSITLFSHGDKHTQSIPSGENRGRTVSYTSPVQDYASLGRWDGEARSVSYNVGNLDPAKGYAVLVHERNSVGAIKAAGQIKL
ncbi:MAG: DUF1223 domain-containing protein [Pseudomonadota bacterium]